jgi:hypothetical protein
MGACREVRSGKTDKIGSFCDVTGFILLGRMWETLGGFFGVRGTIQRPSVGLNISEMAGPQHISGL